MKEVNDSHETCAFCVGVMKSPWTRLMKISKSKGKDMEERQFDRIFFAHHMHAEEILCGNDGRPIVAIYMTPTAHHRIHAKQIFEEMRRRFLMGYEN